MSDDETFECNRLFAKVSEGDLQAFELLYNSYKNRIYSLALKLTKAGEIAEEIVQEVFLSIWVSRAGLKKVENADAYLFTIAYNKIFSHLRSVSKNQLLVQQLIKNYRESSNVTKEQIELNDSVEIMNQLISKLPEQRRLIFLLKKEEGMSSKEIADRLHISPHTVRNQLAEAKKQIRELLSKKGLLGLLLMNIL